jgi:hypothetical protein
MTQLNNKRYIVANKTANTFELTHQVTGANIDGTAFTAYASAGQTAKIYTLTTPYTTAQLRDLKYVQTGDVVTIVHRDHHPKELSRLALASWTLTDITFAPTIDFPRAFTGSGGTGAVAGSYKITAISESGEESLAGLGNTPGSTAITGVTQANPAVVSATAHGLVAGDICYIEGIVGMTELNGRQFTVANESANTFEETTNSTDVAFTWTAEPAAVRYRIFKLSSGVFGFLASTEATTYTDDGTVTPDLSDTPPRLVEPFIGTNNRPGAVGFHRQRRILGGSNNEPDTLYHSVVGSFNNFSAGVPIRADDGFSFTLSSRQVNQIEAMTSVNDLLIFTSGAEWDVTTATDPAYSIDTVQIKPQSTWGSSILPPISIGNTVLMSQDVGGSVRALKYNIEIDGYATNDLSILVPHMFEDKTMLEWDYATTPDPIIYIVRDDGEVLTLTFNEEQQVVAWTKWDTKGKFESVAVIRPGIADNQDAAYFVVKRTINGNTVRWIERTDNRIFDNSQDAFFLDGGLSFDNPVTLESITRVNPLVVTSTAHGFEDGDVVDIDNVVWDTTTDSDGNPVECDQLNGKRFTITNKTANTFELIEGEEENPSVTNLIKWSNDFTQWDEGAGAGDIVVYDPDTIGPNGVDNNVYIITDDSAGFEYIADTADSGVSDDSEWYAGSVFVKKTSVPTTGFPELEVTVTGGAPQIGSFTQFDPFTGEFNHNKTAGATASGNVEDYSPDWWKVTAAIKNNSSGNTSVLARIDPASGLTLTTDAGAAVGAISIACFQLEKGAELTSDTCILTEGAPATSTVGLVDSTGWCDVLDEGEIREAVDSVTGLGHLESECITVLAGGAVISDLCVDANGGITFPNRFSRIHTGIPYISEIETLNPELTKGSIGTPQTIQSKLKKIPEVTIRFYRTRGARIGPNSANLIEMKQREFENIGAPTDLITGDKVVKIPASWNSNGRLIVRQVDPLPLTVLAIIPEITSGDR